MGKEKEIVTCKLNGKKYRKENCPYPDNDCITCIPPEKPSSKDCKKGMIKQNDGKGKYRKKKYTPQKITQNSFSKYLLREYQKKYKLTLKLRKELEEVNLEEDSDLSQIAKSLIDDTTLYKEAFEILIDACKKGSSINPLYDLPSPGQGQLSPDVYDFPLIALMDNRVLHRDFPEALKKYEEKRKNYIKKEKAIKSAVKLLYNLSPISEDIKHHPDTSVEYISVPDFNNDLLGLQFRLKATMDIYLDLLAMDNEASYIFKTWQIKNPRSWIKKKYKTAKKEYSGMLNGIIINLVDKFIDIGYSKKQAYIRTERLLHCFYPHLDTNPGLVRQRYTYTKGDK